MRNHFDKFFHNFYLKLGSLFIAIVLWALCTTSPSSVHYETFTVPISYINQNQITENGYVITNKETLPTEVKVQISGSYNQIIAVDESNIYAFVDCGQINFSDPNIVDEEISLMLQISIRNAEVEIESPINRTVNIQLDYIETTEEAVEVATVGDLPENYSATVENLSDETVMVTGASQEIDEIDKVYVEADLTNKTENTTLQLQPKAVDENGEELEVTFDPAEVSADIVVEKIASIPIEYEIVGQVADGYIMGEVVLEPNTVTIQGPPEKVDAITSIKLEPYDVTGANATQVVEYNINDYLVNSGVRIVDDSPATCSLTINISPNVTSKTVTLEPTDITVINPNEYEFILPESVDVTISGNETDIDNITAESLNAQLDLTDVEYGKTTIPLSLTVPNGVSINENFIEIEVVEPDLVESNSPDTSATPTEPTETVEPSEPVDSVEPSDPVETAEPTEDLESSEPAEPSATSDDTPSPTATE